MMFKFGRLQSASNGSPANSAPLRGFVSGSDSQWRRRNLTTFLALTYLAVEGIVRAALAGEGQSHHTDDPAAVKPAANGPDPVDLSGGGDTPEITTAEADGTSGQAPIYNVAFSSVEYHVSKSFTFSPVGQTHSQAGGSSYHALTGGHSGDGGMYIPSVGASAGPGEAPPPFIPKIAFFDGLDAFSNSLGFGGDLHNLTSLLPDAAKGLAGNGLLLGSNPLAPVQYWQSVGAVSAQHQFDKSDSFNAEYAVQANGLNNGVNDHAQASSGAGILMSQSGDGSSKSLENTATLVDGGDWTGGLLVKGNYYEFNTIVQINVLWNHDNVTVIQSGSGAAGGVINTGGNEQQNYAQIIESADTDYSALTHYAGLDASASGTPTQIFAGGFDKYHSVIQTNILVQNDSIEFVIDDIVSGGSQYLTPGAFSDVIGGQQVQGNDSLIATGGQSVQPVYHMNDFVDYLQNFQKTTVEVVDGDYYEFNTVFQLNVVNDDETVSHTSGGAQAAGSDAIASGGNIQINYGSIEKHDAHDYLYVGGTYSQYNLVMQLNVLDSGSSIKQISTLSPTQSGDLDAVVDIDGSSGTHSTGGDGADGGYQSITIPTHSDELAVRGMAVDGLI